MYGVWSAAKEQGEIAGLAMIGQDVDYQGSVIGARIKAAGIDVASIGDFSMTPSTTVEVFHEKDIFKKYFREGNKLKGAILIGDTSDYFNLQKEIAK
jgi:NAD(P)H-nitrite reductase large subunit